MLDAAGADSGVVYKRALKGFTMAGAGQPTGFFDTLPSVSTEKLKSYDRELRKALKRGPQHLEKLLSKKPSMDGQESVMAHTHTHWKSRSWGNLSQDPMFHSGKCTSNMEKCTPPYLSKSSCPHSDSQEHSWERKSRPTRIGPLTTRRVPA